MTRTALAWALEALVVAHLSMIRIADALGVAWDTANINALAEGRRVLSSDGTRFEWGGWRVAAGSLNMQLQAQS